MEKAPIHSWNITPHEAVKIQKALRGLVRHAPLKAEPRLIAGADVSLERGASEGFAGFSFMSYPGLEDRGYALSRSPLNFPYVPGLLSFREIPLLVEAWEATDKRPDVVLVDGHGIAHPRRMGIATHLGLYLGVPTIGVAKSVLAGTYGKLGEEPGSTSYLTDKGEVVGVAMRTKAGANPIFISPGHLMTLDQAVALVVACLRGYRLPEPTRRAHELVNKFRRNEIGAAETAAR